MMGSRCRAVSCCDPVYRRLWRLKLPNRGHTPDVVIFSPWEQLVGYFAVETNVDVDAIDFYRVIKLLLEYGAERLDDGRVLFLLIDG
jgi:hypothetical protein